MIVLDASALLKFVAREPGWIDVEMLIARGCATLYLAVSEVALALELGVRQGALDPGYARRSLEALEELLRSRAIELLEDYRFAVRALEISRSRRLGVLDSMYVAAAEELGELATCVKRQALVAKELGIKVVLL